MNKLLMCCALLVMFVVSGCVVRTYTVERDRVDQEILGNRGVIMGTPPAVEETQVRKTREIYNIEVEVPSTYRTAREMKAKAEDRDLYGNRGYVQGAMNPEKEVYVPGSGSSQVSTTRLSGGRMPQIIYSEPSGNAGAEGISSGSENQEQYYVVQKGDTLQKISQRFFGTTQKWKSIYDANKDVLKSPDRIRPGQKLVIPKD